MYDESNKFKNIEVLKLLKVKPWDGCPVRFSYGDLTTISPATIQKGT